MKIEININDTVKVKLTEFGKKILRSERLVLDEDKDGYSEWQLWYLMRVFGEHMVMGGNEPFETTIIIERN